MTDQAAVQLPALIESDTGDTGASPSFTRTEPDASFLSQLIAERDHLAAQRSRRRAPLGDAITAYGEGERSDQRRLPHGFFRTAEA